MYYYQYLRLPATDMFNEKNVEYLCAPCNEIDFKTHNHPHTLLHSRNPVMRPDIFYFCFCLKTLAKLGLSFFLPEIFKCSAAAALTFSMWKESEPPYNTRTAHSPNYRLQSFTSAGFMQRQKMTDGEQWRKIKLLSQLLFSLTVQPINPHQWKIIRDKRVRHAVITDIQCCQIEALSFDVRMIVKCQIQ